MTGVALFTTCVNTREVEPIKLVSPLYTAVMGWLPPERVDVVKLTVAPTTGTDAMDVPLSLNDTVPVAPAGRVAVNVTGAPKIEAFGEETRLTVEFD